MIYSVDFHRLLSLFLVALDQTILGGPHRSPFMNERVPEDGHPSRRSS